MLFDEFKYIILIRHLDKDGFTLFTWKGKKCLINSEIKRDWKHFSIREERRHDIMQISSDSRARQSEFNSYYL